MFLFFIFYLGCKSNIKEDTGSSVPLVVASYTEIKEIIDRSCADCHPGGARPPKLDENLCETIVGIPSSQASLNIVEVGDASNSYLLYKLKGTQESVGGRGTRMPLESPLDDAEIDKIASWIDGGASCIMEDDTAVDAYLFP